MTGTPPASLLLLLTWTSPGFPTGAFAHSHGIERAVADGLVTSEAQALDWINALVELGAGRTDAILLRHAHAARDAGTLAELSRLASALPASRELREETLAQGAAFLAAASPWGAGLLAEAASLLADGRIAHPLALGALAASHGIDADQACLAFLHGLAANLVSSALRLVPLGQNAALRVQRALEPAIASVTNATRGATLDGLGASCFRSDAASMRHETQDVRLFRT